MDVLDFTVLKKKIECDVKQVVGDNDYQASFMFDEEWDDKEVICRVIWNNKTSLDITLEDYSCVIPAYFVKTGEISVGVYVDGEENLATTPWKLGVLKSVKESVYGTAVPHKEVWDEINEKVADMVTNSEFDAKVNDYLTKQNIPSDIAQAKTDIVSVAHESAGAIVCNVSGSVVSANDASDKGLHQITLYGKSTQDGTPSIDAPVDIVSVGDDGNVGVEVCGKNVLKPERYIGRYNSGIALCNFEEMTFPYVPNNESWGLARVARCKKGYTYTFSVTNPNANYTLSIAEYKSLDDMSDASKVVKYIQFKQVTSLIFTASADGYLICLLAGLWSNGTTNIHECTESELLQLEISDIPTEYEPSTYQSATINLAEPLRGLPVDSGGNYTDADGQQWICDTLEVFADGTGKLTQRVAKIVFNGSEKWNANTSWNEQYSDYFHGHVSSNKLLTNSEENNPLLCNMLPCYNSVFVNTPKEMELCSAHFGNKGIYLFIHKDKLVSYDGQGLSTYVKSLYDAGTPIEVIFLLATPIVTELTVAQVQALHSYKPNTVITTDDMGDIAVEYIADSKTYIDNKFTELANAIIASGATE